MSKFFTNKRNLGLLADAVAFVLCAAAAISGIGELAGLAAIVLVVGAAFQLI